MCNVNSVCLHLVRYGTISNHVPGEQLGHAAVLQCCRLQALYSPLLQDDGGHGLDRRESPWRISAIQSTPAAAQLSQLLQLLQLASCCVEWQPRLRESDAACAGWCDNTAAALSWSHHSSQLWAGEAGVSNERLCEIKIQPLMEYWSTVWWKVRQLLGGDWLQQRRVEITDNRQPGAEHWTWTHTSFCKWYICCNVVAQYQVQNEIS